MLFLPLAPVGRSGRVREECGASGSLEKPAGDPQWSSGVIGFSTERKLVASGKIPGIQFCLSSFASNQGFFSEVRGVRESSHFKTSYTALRSRNWRPVDVTVTSER